MPAGSVMLPSGPVLPELVLGAAGDRVVLGRGEAVLHSRGPSCIPAAHPASPGPVPQPSLGWQDAGCSGYPGGAAPGCLGWQLQDLEVWLQKVGAGTACLSPGATSCLPGRGQGPGSWHCLVPAPSAFRVPWVALQSQASRRSSGLVLARLLGQTSPSRAGGVPAAAPCRLGEQDPLPFVGGPGHKCTFTSHP